MHVSYDIVDMRVAISFTDRMFHFLLDGHAHSHALSTLPASQLGSQTQPCRALLPCTIISIVHGNSARHGWVWLPNCDAGGLGSARLSPPASGRGRLLTSFMRRAVANHYATPPTIVL